MAVERVAEHDIVDVDRQGVQDGQGVREGLALLDGAGGADGLGEARLADHDVAHAVEGGVLGCAARAADREAQLLPGGAVHVLRADALDAAHLRGEAHLEVVRGAGREREVLTHGAAVEFEELGFGGAGRDFGAHAEGVVAVPEVLLGVPEAGRLVREDHVLGLQVVAAEFTAGQGLRIPDRADRDEGRVAHVDGRAGLRVGRAGAAELRDVAARADLGGGRGEAEGQAATRAAGETVEPPAQADHAVRFAAHPGAAVGRELHAARGGAGAAGHVREALHVGGVQEVRDEHFAGGAAAGVAQAEGHADHAARHDARRVEALAERQGGRVGHVEAGDVVAVGSPTAHREAETAKAHRG